MLLFFADSDISLYIEIYKIEKILQRIFLNIDKNNKLNRQYILAKENSNKLNKDIEIFGKRKKYIIVTIFSYIETID